ERAGRAGRLCGATPLQAARGPTVGTTPGLVRDRRGFYGLVAEGWDLTDFGSPWPRGPLPPEVLVSEFIVGFLDRERGAGVEWSAAEFRGAAATYFVQHACVAPYIVTDNDLRQVRDKRQELFAQ